MKIAIRADSSSKVGTGHINRCITLAKQFKKRNINVIFISRSDKGNINKNIIKSGFRLVTVHRKKKNILYDSKKTNYYIKKLNIDFILIDNNFINYSWEKKIDTSCKIILLKDFLNRKTLCQYYINYHNIKKINYDKKFLIHKNCVKFYGPKYSIIKPINIKKRIKPLKNIFIFMGGVDNKNVSSKIISILKSSNFINFNIKVMIGEKNLRKKIIIKQIKKLKNFSYVSGKYKDLYNFFQNSNFIIINAGVSMYENLAFGNNSLIIAQSDEHRKILKNYSGLNLFNYINNIKKLKKKYLIDLLKKKKKISESNNYFDTMGASRIAKYFSRLK
jgi:UDP-2,4-diacetamido-2,4,6-trideoxy-beta-L-altropyranose hydrolase